MTLKFKRAFEHDWPLPSRHSPGAAGYDLRNAGDDVVIYPGTIELIPTGWCVEVPQGYVGIVKDRSGHARAGITTHAGVIDSDYRGEVIVMLGNATESPSRIKKASRIAQLLIVPCLMTDAEEVGELTDTERGSNGFGSTGMG